MALKLILRQLQIKWNSTIKVDIETGVSILDPKKKTISQAVFVMAYDRDTSIRSKQFDIEKAVLSLVGGPTVNTNLPDEFSPNAPRITAAKGKVSLAFSQVAAQLTISIDNVDGHPIEKIRDSITKRIYLFQSAVDKVIAKEKQRERGVVLFVNYPVDMAKFSVEDMGEYLQSRFVKVAPFGIPMNATLAMGYKTEDKFYFNWLVSIFRTVEGKDVTVVSGESVDFSDWPVVELGVQLKVDVNNRPKLESSQLDDDLTAEVLAKAFSFVLDDADNFIGAENE